MNFKEFYDFGFNLLSLSVVVLISLTIWQLFVYIKQAYIIWKLRSAESVSSVFTITVFSALFAFGIYGLKTRSLVLIINGLVSLPAFVTCVGAFKYGKVKRLEVLVASIGVLGLLCFCLPLNPAHLFLMFALSGTIPLISQLKKLYKVAKRGVMKGELLATFMVKNFFFTLFAFTIPGGEPVLQICAPLWLFLSIWLFVKWANCPITIRSAV